MKSPHKVFFITIVPSPYQRDLFGALAAREDVDLNVCYMEAQSPDSPWPSKLLRSFERILPGFWIPIGGARGHVNWDLPELSNAEIIVLSSFTSLTGQWLMRRALGGKPWLFWGERLGRNKGVKRFLQSKLIAPVGKASGVVGVGRAAELDYSSRFPHLQHFSIPYHCDLSAFLPIRRRIESAAPVTFLFCGQMIRRKGVDLLLAAFERLIKKGYNTRLLLVGREADLPQFLAPLSPTARSRICYEGFQAPECLPEYFARSDVFILPSRHDGWGVVVNQALAAGLPIITSDAVGAGLDLVENGGNGLRVPADDADALYSAMETMASNPELRSKWGERSRKVAGDLTPEAGAEKWVRVFEQFRS
jgi:glycosyltransferase involved in cell wall biosynthesis